MSTAISSSKNVVENNLAFLVPAIPAATEVVITCFATGSCTVIAAAVLSTIMSVVQLEEYKQNGDQVVILDPNWTNNVLTSEEYVPPNLSPEGAGRSGTFNEAKRKSGIPVSTHPDRVVGNLDRRGKNKMVVYMNLI